MRSKLNEYGVLIDTHGDYPVVTRMIAREMDVPLIDLQYYTELLEISYGVEGSKSLHLHYAPGSLPYYPDGKEDDTHLSEKGATEIARLAVEEIRKMNIMPLAAKIK
ncbi:MAG: hypothetical protein KDC85_09160 [Saprospiraceae bacterium]|nr:hypothetical protein [Saprospiraceae bacterium]MCB9326660.1 hypothetical protein [Lewinellaceae bacterium]